MTCLCSPKSLASVFRSRPLSHHNPSSVLSALCLQDSKVLSSAVALTRSFLMMPPSVAIGHWRGNSSGLSSVSASSSCSKSTGWTILGSLGISWSCSSASSIRICSMSTAACCALVMRIFSADVSHCMAIATSVFISGLLISRSRRCPAAWSCRELHCHILDKLEWTNIKGDTSCRVDISLFQL